MTPFLQDADFTLYNCDVLEGLAQLEDESVHCIVTSPPYWGLRDYGTGTWEITPERDCPDCAVERRPGGMICKTCLGTGLIPGGDADCDHKPPIREHGVYKNGQGQAYKSSNTNWDSPHKSYGQECGKCGARRVDNQLGLEPTPEAWVERMVEVFREVRRVLRKDGTCWLNIGDSYLANVGVNYGTTKAITGTGKGGGRADDPDMPRPTAWGGGSTSSVERPANIKPKDLAMIPARLALALQADGWYLRSQIVWAKPNPMPESVSDRPTSAYEFIYLLTRSPRYFYDGEAVREPHAETLATRDRYRYPINSHAGGRGQGDYPGEDRNGGSAARGQYKDRDHTAGRNLRNVWEIPTEPFPEAHFATYPTELVRRCIAAGTSERGCCPECGAPWVREVEEQGYTKHRPSAGNDPRSRTDDKQAHGSLTGDHGWKGNNLLKNPPKTTGWRLSCGCAGMDDEAQPPIPCTVFDPFMGSGTTALVARKLGRRCVGIELNPDYCELTAKRTQQLSLEAV